MNTSLPASYALAKLPGVAPFCAAHSSSAWLPLDLLCSLVCIVSLHLQVPTRVLMGPGPSNSHPRVLTAQALPLLGHMHPPFFKVTCPRPCSSQQPAAVLAASAGPLAGLSVSRLEMG